MAITTLDGAIAGMQFPVPIVKTGITTAAVGAMRGYTLWYAAGNPGAATANAAGVNGAAITTQQAGALTRVDPGSGNAHLARLSMLASTAGTMWLIDRMWHNSGLSTTLTTAQAITPATLPARDRAGTTDGADVMAALEWSSTGGAGTPTCTLTYTNQAGTASRSAVLTAVTTPPVGTFEIFTLAAGDTGVRAPTSFIQTATRNSGAYHLVLFRVLAQFEMPASNIANSIDALTSGLPRLYNNTNLQLVWFPSTTTATNFAGTYIETQG